MDDTPKPKHAVVRSLDYRSTDSARLDRWLETLVLQKGSDLLLIPGAPALPTKVPSLSELHLPPAVESLAHLAHGLVLVGGPAGSGKSTTLAALIDVINRRDARHIVTIEDPIEYEHTHVKSVVEQVEIG